MTFNVYCWSVQVNCQLRKNRGLMNCVKLRLNLSRKDMRLSCKQRRRELGTVTVLVRESCVCVRKIAYESDVSHS